MSADPLAEWHVVLEQYDADGEHLTEHLAWYPELVRELMRCRGVEQLQPWTSHMYLFLSTPSGIAIQPMMDRNAGDYVVWWSRPSGREECRRCPHLKSVVRAIRVAARQCGVKISQPPRVQPEANSLRRVWVVFPRAGAWG